MKQVTPAAFYLRHGRGNDLVISGLLSLSEDTTTMAQEFQTSRCVVGRAESLDRRWLARLIEAMEQAARPETRSVPCDANLISAVSAHLARPGSAFAQYGSAYNLRN
ncbi:MULTISPECIES: hypothetical protein [unclassified Bradyrhizobium]|uniref:hypothetical protein n=1 Tax=unclassified Bradyrhizobium TaxID=2631580 RepID=UPI00247AA379|nr:MULTISPECIES: hypothetical protein [unclassified Bradyrhizobium]WGS17718.1 hypothetical protein MTX22_24165 [Bradyrhizobium sp. ISRA463]WGS24512.1 hypothetical protein MTX19_21830 [Bradyrhizobium sp. ISRA464]